MIRIKTILSERLPQNERLGDILAGSYASPEAALSSLDEARSIVGELTHSLDSAEQVTRKEVGA